MNPDRLTGHTGPPMGTPGWSCARCANLQQEHPDEMFPGALEHSLVWTDLWGAVGVGWLTVMHNPLHEVPELRPHVYTVWTDDEELLYVGQSRRLLRRLREHMRKSPWVDSDGYIEWTRFDTLDEAMLAEAATIQDLEPRHNRVRPHVLP